MELEGSGAAVSNDEAGDGSSSDDDEGLPTPQQPRTRDLNSKRVARAILGLPAPGDVTMEDIGCKFKEVALVWHPDKSAQPKDRAKEVFQRINMAKRDMPSISSGDLPSQGEGAGDDESEADEASEEGDISIQLFEKVDVAKLHAMIAAWLMLEIRHKYSADKWREMYEKLVRSSKRLRADGTVEVIHSQAPPGIGPALRTGGLVIAEHASGWGTRSLDSRLFQSDIT
jgi:hypothetical protein